MSKGEGRFITVKFTEDIISEVNPLIQGKKELKTGFSVSGSSTGSLANLIDGNTGSVWGHYSASNYVQVTVPNDIRFTNGFKIYVGASSRPTGYIVSVSDNGSTYTAIKTGSIAQVTGWQEFMLDLPIRNRYIRV